MYLKVLIFLFYVWQCKENVLLATQSYKNINYFEIQNSCHRSFSFPALWEGKQRLHSQTSHKPCTPSSQEGNEHLKTFPQRQCSVVVGRGDPGDLPASDCAFYAKLAEVTEEKPFQRPSSLISLCCCCWGQWVSVIMILTHKYRCENSHWLQHKWGQGNTLGNPICCIAVCCSRKTGNDYAWCIMEAEILVLQRVLN